jgi:hypothetical protein
VGAVGAFVANVEVGQRHESVTGPDWSLAEIREDQVLAVDWERLVAAAQGIWHDSNIGSLPALLTTPQLPHLAARKGTP